MEENKSFDADFQKEIYAKVFKEYLAKEEDCSKCGDIVGESFYELLIAQMIAKQTTLTYAEEGIAWEYVKKIYSITNNQSADYE